jgi:hypothetical protein
MSILNTKGHIATNGGIRGHSAGDAFPFTVVAKGASPIWVVRLPNGTYMEREHTTARNAEHEAVQMKLLYQALGLL